MTVTIKTKGLDQLIKNAKDLDGSHQVRLGDLMNPAFMAKYTKSPDLDSFFVSAGYSVETEADLLAIPDEPWDEYVKTHSSFSSWEEMRKQAAADYMRARLMKGIKG